MRMIFFILLLLGATLVVAQSTGGSKSNQIWVSAALMGDNKFRAASNFIFDTPDFNMYTGVDGRVHIKINATSITSMCKTDANGMQTCTVGTLITTGGVGKTAGEIVLSEIAVNGNAYVSIKGPDSLAKTYTLQLPDKEPTDGQTLTFSSPVQTPQGLVAVGSWK